ncbi:winged helix DNA-binding domain-containing protein [Solitalea longa]|uniref:Winged helix DNA-binding domain-containing protein n=1 Tax=Solitalea longa TaxID=2079460 RepID=A0A2S5A380_9SPHI|nr:winged helix DNA-binding domain-containing protein [Solitalea longa]POY37031.1 winged helix DNA-binding domain-containing protein [Solitalea longa]
MTLDSLINYRLHNQLLTRKPFNTIEETVEWMGALQAQDYPAAKWALSTRWKDCTNSQIEETVNKGTIVRTWALRGTLHLVTTKDIGWMIDLLKPGALSRSKSHFKSLELTDTVLAKAEKIMEHLMTDGIQVSRKDLFAELEKNHISTKSLRGIHILYWASFQKIICHGAMNEKQFTYRLLSPLLQDQTSLTKEECLAELAKRYFFSHGPATLADFVWWSGLNLTDAKKGLEIVKPLLASQVINTETYWFQPDLPAIENNKNSLFLVAAFDQYFLGYRNRELVIEKSFMPKVATVNGIFNPLILFNGGVIGTWKRALKKDKVIVELNPFSVLTMQQKELIQVEATKYGKHLEVNVEVIF